MDQPYEGDPESLVEQENQAIVDENPEAVTPPETIDSAPQPGGLSKDEQDALIALVDQYEHAEEDYRAAMLREWKLMEHFWNDNQHNVWSETAQDWRPIEDYMRIENDDLDLEGFEPRTVNIYKAHGESVIAAMAAGIPATKFFPDDADSQADISTAKVYSKAAEMLQRRNKAPLLLIRSLYIMWNQGVVGFYNFARTDPRLGTISQPIPGWVMSKRTESYCPQCGSDMQPGAMGATCANCGYQGQPDIDEVPEEVPGIVGEEEVPRITEDIKAYSPLYFRIPHRATSQDECPYITLDTEQSPGSIIAAFKKSVPNIRELVDPTRDEEKYDRWARNLSNDRGYGESELVTVRQRWVRNWALEEIENDQIRESLLAKFPNGVYFVQAGENFIHAHEEDMDDHWTITTSPTSPHLLCQALGKSLKTVQELTNELVTMTIDNIEHGTPMMMADSDLLNLKKYKDSRVAPGAMYPVKVPAGQSITNLIHETKPSTLSEEVRYFSGELKEFGQFVSGAFPSIYGGSISSGSGTAKEYEMSRAQALQRLQITWRVISEAWTDMISKSTRDYLKNLRYDEKFVKPQGKMGFVNVWIRKSEMQGKIGEVVAETSESFPISNLQKRDLMMKLLLMENPNIDAAVFHPENSGNVATLLGFDEFYIPGDDDRSKQLNEIIELLASQPMPGGIDPMTGQPMLQPSILPDADIDNHPIHKQTIAAFLISEIGQQVKKENPIGYQNCLAHFKAHEMAEMIQMMKQGMMGGGEGQEDQEGGGGSPEGEASDVEAPAGVESGEA
jgi:hypothetical protein